MNCETALELLSASLDGELTPDQETLLQAHLEQCPNCRVLQTELAGLHATCGEMQTLPPAQLKEQILANLPPQRSAKVIYWKRWGAMAAALALIALAAWRLPHSLYDRSVPTTDANDPQQAASSSEITAFSGAITGGSAEPGLATAQDMDEMALDIDNSDMPPAYGPDTPALLSLPIEETHAVAPTANAKRTIPAEGAEAAKKESAVTDGYLFTAASGGGSLPQDNAVVPENGAVQPRMALFSAMPDPIYTVDPDDTDLVVEPDPLDGEEPIAVQPLVAVEEDIRDFSQYSAVVVLTGVDFEGDYPRQKQENGDMWYLLPRSALESLPQTLEEGSMTYSLRLEGDDLAPEAPYVLVVVPSGS